MPTYEIQHITLYTYDAPVIDNINQIKIYPFQSDDQNVIRQDLYINNEPSIHHFIDYWGNRVGVFNLNEPHYHVKIDNRIIVHKRPKPMRLMKPLSPILKLDYSTPEKIASVAKLNDILKDAPLQEHRRTITEWCNNFVYNHFTYEKGITDVETTIDDILQHGKGVCQDFSHLLLQMLRLLNIPCRYVSGYICPNKNGMRGQGATHAWIEVWLEDYGWYGIDPTNNMWVNETHIKLAVGRNFNDCSPVKGSFKGLANQKLSIYVSVGYEDGHVVEDLNEVVMTQERITTPAVMPLNFQMQQQQQ